MATQEERFWKKVDKSGDCWLWTASTNNKGYGKFRIAGKSLYSHRVSYEMNVGPIPQGMQVDHLCYVRNCVNFSHLRLVTHKQNLENRFGAQRNSKSGIRGVSWNARESNWRAQIKHDGKVMCVGRFDTIAEAESAAITKRLELFTHNDTDRIAV
jgi:hypothetical protein